MWLTSSLVLFQGLIFSFCIVSVADVFVCTVSGADMLECDIALTKDLRLILLYESWLGEITDAKNKLDPTKKKTRSDYNLPIMNPFDTLSFCFRKDSLISSIWDLKYF